MRIKFNGGRICNLCSECDVICHYLSSEEIDNYKQGKSISIPEKCKDCISGIKPVTPKHCAEAIGSLINFGIENGPYFNFKKEKLKLMIEDIEFIDELMEELRSKVIESLKNLK